MKRFLATLAITIAVFLVWSAADRPARAAVHTEYVDYSQGGTALRGYLAYDDANDHVRPGVLIVHEWTGEGEYVERRARQLAELGYVAFACDVYGKGVRPQPKDAGAIAGIYKNDRKLTRERMAAGLAQLKSDKRVDPKRIAAIGYCFGGMCALELARSGANIAGVVVFHGALDTPTPGDAANIKCKVLALQGGDDPFVPQSDVAAFEKEMRDARVDWQLVQYGNTVHAYTNPVAGSDPSKGAAYNPVSDRRSWQAMRDFFGEIFTAGA